MKKVMVYGLSALLLMSSCGSYEASGAYAGANFGSIIGSAVGGLTGGWRGSEWGQLAGLAGGAVVGAAIGKAADQKAQRRAEERAARRMPGNSPARGGGAQVDDRIMVSGMQSPAAVPLEIRHAQLIDMNGDGLLSRGEEARVVFEVYNPTQQAAYGVRPIVAEVTGNRHIHISENILIESIQPRQGIRYTAMVKADNGLRNGEAVIRVGVLQGGGEIVSQAREFRFRTSKR